MNSVKDGGPVMNEQEAARYRQERIALHRLIQRATHACEEWRVKYPALGKRIVEIATEYADAMLAAREAGGGK